MSVYPSPIFFYFSSIVYLSIIYFNAGFTISPCLSFFNVLVLHVLQPPGYSERGCESCLNFSNPCSFRDIENYKEVEDLNPVVGYCEGTLWGCESCL